MAWFELHLTTTAEHVAFFSDQLTLLGAQAVTLQDAGDQPIYEPSETTPRIWFETILIGLFDYEQALLPILTVLEEYRTAGLLKDIVFKEVADANWVRRSLDSFGPLSFGKRLWVCPSWQIPPVPTAINVLLDPGLAFGTGMHPTTALCLEWLDAHSPAQYVIDYGCGSGILSLAALKLGAEHVLAVDKDPQALQATQNNAARNGVSSQLSVAFPDAVAVGERQADLLLANILTGLLIEMAPYFAKLIKPQGKIVLSGILADQVNAVIEAYQAAFLIQPPVYKEEWARLVGERK